jgi:hypothetical protein
MTMTVFNFIGFSMHEVVRSVTHELNLHLFDFFEIFKQLEPNTYLNDDIHPQKPFYLFELNQMIAYLSYIQNITWIVKGL